MLLRTLTVAGICLLWLSAPAAQGALTREDRELFKWFDSLGYTPDLSDKPLVMVSTGDWTAQGTAVLERVPERRLGFLLSERGDAFVVHLTSAINAQFVRSGPVGDRAPVEMTRLNLRATADTMLRTSDELAAGAVRVDLPRVWRTPLTYVMLARASAAAGMDEIAHALLESARAAEADPRHLQQDLAGTIANHRIAVAFSDFERGGTRAALRDEVKRLIVNFPQADFAKTETAIARQMSRELDRMVNEDLARAKRPVAADKLEGRAQIAEWIYLLRDQYGPQRTMPGYPDFVCGWVLSDAARRACENDITPVRRLINAGPAAVPQLIEALDDTRLTRAVHYYRAGQPVDVLRVGDCALQILETMSGLRFTDVTATLHARTKNEQKAVKDRVMAWWNTMKGKG